MTLCMELGNHVTPAALEPISKLGKKTRCVDELYTFTDLVRLFKVRDARLREMRQTGDMLGPDIIIPGGGHKALRWSATRVQEIYRQWRIAD